MAHCLWEANDIFCRGSWSENRIHQQFSLKMSETDSKSILYDSLWLKCLLFLSTLFSTVSSTDCNSICKRRRRLGMITNVYYYKSVRRSFLYRCWYFVSKCSLSFDIFLYTTKCGFGSRLLDEMNCISKSSLKPPSESLSRNCISYLFIDLNK